MLTWKIVGASKASILYIYIDKQTSFHFQPSNYTVQSNFIRTPKSSSVIYVGIAEVLIGRKTN